MKRKIWAVSEKMNTKNGWRARENQDGVWYLVEPKSIKSNNEMFNRCVEHLNEEEYQTGKSCLERLLDLCPNHIEARNHLAVLYDEEGDQENALELRKENVDIGREALPKDFGEEDELPWGFTQNRPFLRALKQLGIAHLDNGDVDKALSIFEENLSYNPSDNQGVRDLLIEVYLEKGLLDEVIKIRKKFPDDAMPGPRYGNALALFKKGEREKATEELKDAVEDLPKVAKELLKDKHEEPDRIMPGMISFGGWDQAYEYWKAFGEYWEKDELKWLEEVLDEVKSE